MSFDNDFIREIKEKSYTSKYAPESLKENELYLVNKDPNNFIEINILTRSEMIDTFYIASNLNVFTYKDKKYNIKDECIYLLPLKKSSFMFSVYYKENNKDPIRFSDENKGITGKALTLLYDESLYTDMFSDDMSKYNFFIVILSLVTIILLAIGFYMLFFNVKIGENITNDSLVLTIKNICGVIFYG